MLPAPVPPDTWLQVAAIVATAIVGAWVTVRVAKLDRQAKHQRRLSRAERQRCNGLEARVIELEKALGACVEARKPRRARSRRKG
jgi:hypothetical protein